MRVFINNIRNYIDRVKIGEGSCDVRSGGCKRLKKGAYYTLSESYIRMRKEKLRDLIRMSSELTVRTHLFLFSFF